MHSGPWMDAVKDCDAVVNLVGEGHFQKQNAGTADLQRGVGQKAGSTARKTSWKP